MGMDFGNSILGRTETALLTVEDYREAAEKAKMDSGKKEEGLKALEERLEKEIKKLAGTKTGDGMARREFMVQFNPECLELSGSVQTEEKDNLTRGKTAATRQVIDTELTLSVKLIFDRVTNQDAFYWDRVTPSAGSAASGLVQAGRAIAGKHNTVQTEVEGFISAISNRYTRILTFSWGDFSFRGMLKSLSAEYSMFSTSGRPIRAKVDMQIQNKAGSEMVKAWNQSYREAFGGGAVLTAPGQAVGSFLTI